MSVVTPDAGVSLADWVDPEWAWCGWAGGYGHAFWLDAGPGAASGISWVGIGVPVAAEAVRAVPLSGAAHHGSLLGGWVGWLGYDGAAVRAGVPGSYPASDRDDAWLRVSAVARFNHGLRTVTVFAQTDAEALAAEIAELRAPAAAAPAARRRARARVSPGAYAGLVEQCRTSIAAGDAYQLCLTTRFSVPGATDAHDTYRRLRASVSAHRGGLIRIGERTLLSASPESFLSVNGGVVRTRPIKGTRPRHPDRATDAALTEELRTDVKERAENVMIVDLMRNDLSRVCRVGSVTVEDLFAVESYPAVHQLVSTVAGELVAGITLGELLDATFPAGSMTGAPKLSAMRILAEHEGAPRGVFAGCFGWVTPDGDAELSMVIRSIVVDPDAAYVGAGGGVTWLSDPAREVAEVAVKARGPLAALGADLPDGWVSVGIR